MNGIFFLLVQITPSKARYPISRGYRPKQINWKGCYCNPTLTWFLPWTWSVFLIGTLVMLLIACFNPSCALHSRFVTPTHYVTSCTLTMSLPLCSPGDLTAGSGAYGYPDRLWHELPGTSRGHPQRPGRQELCVSRTVVLGRGGTIAHRNP